MTAVASWMAVFFQLLDRVAVVRIIEGSLITFVDGAIWQLEHQVLQA